MFFSLSLVSKWSANKPLRTCCRKVNSPITSIRECSELIRNRFFHARPLQCHVSFAVVVKVKKVALANLILFFHPAKSFNLFSKKCRMNCPEELHKSLDMRLCKFICKCLSWRSPEYLGIAGLVVDCTGKYEQVVAQTVDKTQYTGVYFHT